MSPTLSQGPEAVPYFTGENVDTQGLTYACLNDDIETRNTERPPIIYSSTCTNNDLELGKITKHNTFRQFTHKEALALYKL